MSGTSESYLIICQEGLSQSQEAQKTDELIARFKDERLGELYGGALWTLIHNYKDAKHMREVLDNVQRYLEALGKYEQGDRSPLKQTGGIKQLKDQLAIWLDDSDQTIRGFAATMLGICGDRTYAAQLAKLLARTEQNPDGPIYDRGHAALALGLLQAKEYGKDLVILLSSKNESDRSGAALGLGWMGDKAHAKAVGGLLNDEDEIVREAAKQALEMMGARELMKDKK